MAKENKIKSNIYKYIFIFLILNIINITNVFAATSGLGVRIVLKDVLGQVVAQGIVLRETDSTFDGTYYVLSTLPAFDNDNATIILNDWTQDENNVQSLMNAARFGVTIGASRAHNYVLHIEGIYKTSKTQYRKTTTINGVSCAEWGQTEVEVQSCQRCRAAGCERYGERYCNEYNASCLVCGPGGTRTEIQTACIKEYTDWSDTKPSLETNETLQSRDVVDYLYRNAGLVNFIRTEIDQATKCGLESNYKDNLTLTDVIGSKDYKDGALTTTYWTAYCIEENKFTFPGFKPEVDSGSHFTWTIGQTNNENILNGLTSTLYGKRSCRAISDYNIWKQQYDSYTSKIASYVFTKPKVATCKTDHQWGMVTWQGETYCGRTGIGSTNCFQYVNGVCVAPNNTGSAGGQAGWLESPIYVCPSDTTESGGQCWKNDVSDLISWINAAEDLIKIPDNMANFGTAQDYVLNTEMYIDYDEPVYGINPGENYSKLSSNRLNEKATTENKVVSSKYIAYYSCSLDGVQKSCTNVGKVLSWLDSVDRIFEVNYEYKLDSQFYRYVLLPTGKSVHIVPDSYGSLLTEFQNYINIGHPNYPVHYSTPQGLYNIDIIYKTVGYNNHFEEYIRNEIPQFIDINGNILYDCEYEIDNGEPFCPSGGCDDSSGSNPNLYPGGGNNYDDTNGIKLIYRPISLVTPFPGTDGNGREAGSNWNNQTWINKYILNNRNTTGYSIYQKEPMYQITLKPMDIQKIRAYNKKTTYDDYNLKCINGYECKSEFIRNNNVGFSQYFKGCGTGNWNDCDRKDNYTR